MLRALEGEFVVYDGHGWLVKGFQHKPGWLVAYPRYDLVNRRKMERREIERLQSSHESWWDCLKLRLPLIPLDRVSKPFTGLNTPVLRLLSYLLDFDEEDMEVTGSYLVDPHDAGDVDIVLYGADESTVERLEALVSRGVLKRAGLWHSLREYYTKHVGRVDLDLYLALKARTLLHLSVNGVVVNLRPYRYRSGWHKCVDRVVKRASVRGVIELRDRATPILPARRRAFIGGEEVVFETHKELYAELPPGVYYVEGEIEYRESGVYIVADRGRVWAKGGYE